MSSECKKCNREGTLNEVYGPSPYRENHYICWYCNWEWSVNVKTDKIIYEGVAYPDGNPNLIKVK